MSHSGPALGEPVALSSLLETGLSERPDEPALISMQASWTWRELDRDADRLARNLLSLGLKPGDRVASLLPNRCISEVLYIACIRAGLVATPLNYRYMAPEIDHALSVSKAALMVAHTERQQDLLLSAEVPQLPSGTLFYGPSKQEVNSLEELISQEPEAIGLPAPDPAAPAFIFFTSGSTGPPKGVTHTAETLGWIVASTAAGLRLDTGDRFLTASSLSHEGGVGFSFAALAAGATVAIARQFDPGEYLALFRSARPTVIWILPAALTHLVEDKGASHEDFASLRYCATGGDKLPAELEREFEDKAGFEVHESYGMTEIGCATGNPPNGVNKRGSIGPLFPGYEGEVRDEAGHPLPDNVKGRLWIRSPANMTGYWDQPDETRKAIVGDWLDTGDVMSFDEDGYLWFAGRKKQIIVHDGSNISPQDVEGSLLAHPSVAAAGAVGIHDLVHGENVRAYVVLHPEKPVPSPSELVAFSRKSIGYKAPEDIVFLDKMPLSPAGKTDRTALKKMAEEQINGLCH
ncbi:class I adenylate-forming enzyme family protein [Ruegeria sp. Ofav3-42]|uniref:class I adenylate-forming enzyme family protein n=1 Tax=Ruegeria sp. Ofav3-42 TaxID=2917759 RepID=UPI001EF3DEAC|nr:class I adenylate-forming enzyme family protein [Ruegeria sp. Ofav3-42]MCG7521878.1 acyl--CoA ligase [Ruegeria sp. Ofav3-42]